jgi:Family of unknown function (DUF6188)
MAETPDEFAPDGRWEMPVVGGTVIQVRIDFAFGLVIDGPEGDVSCEVRISSPFRYESSGTSGTVDPAQTERLAPLLVLHNATVVAASATESGRLELRFERDRAISVRPDPNYEAWQLSVTNRTTRRTTGLVSLPGSGTAAFDSP